MGAPRLAQGGGQGGGGNTIEVETQQPTNTGDDDNNEFVFDPGRTAILPEGFQTTYEQPIVLDIDGNPVLDENGNQIPTSTNDFVTLSFRPVRRNNPVVEYLTGDAGLQYQEVRPRYYESDQAFIWLDNNPRAPHTMSPETVASYQTAMVAAGLMGKDDYIPGVWDKVSIDANRNLLRVANVNGASASAMLTFLAQRGGDKLKGSGGKVAPTIRLTSREDLKATFRQVAQLKTGGVFVEDDQIERMVDSYNQSERVYQKALARGGEVGVPPSPQAFAEASLEEVDPGGATANRFQQMSSALDQLIA